METKIILNHKLRNIKHLSEFLTEDKHNIANGLQPLGILEIEAIELTELDFKIKLIGSQMYLNIINIFNKNKKG